MANIPTLNELYTDIIADLEAEFGFTIPLIGKNFLRIIAAVQAGKLKLLYIALGKVQKNIFVDTADPEAIGGTLERFGRVKLGRNPFPATAGQYTIQLTGTVGVLVPAGTTFKSDDTSLNPDINYILDADFTLDGIDIITVRALTAGLEGQLLVADTLTVTAPIALMDAAATVVTEAITPLSAETIETYRQIALDAYRLEPQGGAGADYRLWAADVQAVQQSYPFKTPAEDNEVDLYIEATTIDSIDEKGTPSGATITAVTTAIESPTATQPARKPITDTVNYIAITPLDVDIQVTGFVGLTTEIETSIFNAMKAFLDDVRPFVSSIDILSVKNDIFDVNTIISIILASNPGSVFGAIQLTVDSNIVSTFTFTNGYIPFLNSITYV